MTGQMIAQYKILEKLGEGGMGEVFLAEDTKLNRKVAIKFLPSHLTANEEDRARFLQEARAASAINHSSVCVVHDILEHEDPESGKVQQFIVMEYVKGKTIREIVGESGKDLLPLDNVLDYAVQIAEALTAAHAEDVVHRDIKSENIMVTGTGQVKVMDFGLAKIRGTAKITKSSSTVGTVAYMSPEHIQGQEVDSRSDIFSFGVVLYEMLTGRLPFQGEYDSATMYSILNEEPEPIQQVRSELSSEWLHVLNRSLEKDPESRYQSIKDMLIDLKRLKRDTGRVSRESLKDMPASPKVKGKPKRDFRKGLIPIAIGLLAITIVLLLIFKPWSSKRSVSVSEPKERSLAVMYFENNTGDASLDHWKKALSDLLIADLVQSKYLHVLSGDKLFHILRQMDILEAAGYSSEDLQEVGEQAEVRYILRGNFAKAGDAFRISTVLQMAGTSETVKSETVEGIGEQSIFTMVDDLTRRIRSSFQFTTMEMDTDPDMPVGEITTRSPEAYKLYSEGRRYHDGGEFYKSIELMEKAVELDPEFAMAYRSLAVSHFNLGLNAEAKRYMEKALQHIDNVSQRERYRIQGFYFRQSETTYNEAIEAYEKLLYEYPDDEISRINLGTIYAETEQREKAKAVFQQSIDIGDNRYYAYFWMAILLMSDGQYDKARQILETYIGRYSDHSTIRLIMAVHGIITGRWESALSDIDQGYALVQDSYFHTFRGFIYQCQGLYQKADSTYRNMLQLDNPVDKLNGRLNLAFLALTRGRFEESIRWLDRGIELLESTGESDTQFGLYISRIYLLLRMGETERAIVECDSEIHRSETSGEITRMIDALLYKGMACLGQDDIESARSTMDRMKHLIDDFINPKKIRDYYFLRGAIHTKENNHREAIGSYEKTVQLLTYESFAFGFNAEYFLSLADAYYRVGDIEKARDMYEKITRFTLGIWYYGDVYAKSYYMLGRIYEEHGSIDKAKSYYEKLLFIWEEADEGLPELIDARTRLKNLNKKES